MMMMMMKEKALGGQTANDVAESQLNTVNTLSQTDAKIKSRVV